jgi:hypothetical protein
VRAFGRLGFETNLYFNYSHPTVNSSTFDLRLAISFAHTATHKREGLILHQRNCCEVEDADCRCKYKWLELAISINAAGVTWMMLVVTHKSERAA